MAVPRIEQTRVAIPTTTGDQDITISGFGTPSAAILILSGGVTAGANRADSKLSIGWVDSAGNSFAAGASSLDAQADAVTARTHYSGKVVAVPDTSGAALTNEAATFVSWVTDGIRINWAAAPAAAYLLTVILIGGATLNSAAGALDLGTGTSAINTTLGFTPSAIFTLGCGLAADLVSGNVALTLGAWSPSGGQGSVGTADIDTSPTMNILGNVSATYGFHQLISAGFQYGVTLGTYASGFSATPSANAGSDVMGYLALEFPAGTGVSVTAETLPTSPGNFSKTGLSFKPGFLLEAGAKVSTAVDTVDTADAEGFSVGSVVKTLAAAYTARSTSIGGDDASTTSDASSSARDYTNVEYTGAGGGAISAYADIVSFNSDGWTKNLIATDAVAYKYLSVAIQANEVAAPIFMHQRQMQGMS